MALKKFRPVTPTLRYKTVLSFDEVTDSEPHKALTTGHSKKAGRSKGQIAVRRKGGGHKKKYRIIDFKRDKFDIPGVVESIQYDPNRSANIALVCYKDGERRYIVAPKSLKVGDDVIASKGNVEVKPGNSTLLKNIPVGSNIYNIELHAGKGAQISRSAGTFASISGIEGEYCLVKLPSGELRKIHSDCSATIGEVGNADHINVTIGKAGRSRWLGKRPSVRGVVMNPVDHPLGGGEGKTSGGRHPVSPTGVPAKGYKTRKKKKYSNNMIISRRK